MPLYYINKIHLSLESRPTLAHTADLHGTIPLPVLTGQIIVVSTENEALVAEELNHSAVRIHSTGRRVAGVAPVLRFGEGQTSCKEMTQRRWFQNQ